MILQKLILRIKSPLNKIEFAFLKTRAKHYGHVLIGEQKVSTDDLVIENYFNSSFQKNALISYIVYPFINGVKNNHSNHSECLTIAGLLNELGYNVDIINWNNNNFIPSRHYTIVVDTHNNLERLSSYFKEHVTRILHAANAHWLYQNSIEYTRSQKFFTRTGVAIVPPRLIPEGNSAGYCDAISMFGNHFTRDTYGPYGVKVHPLPMSVTTEPGIIDGKDFEKAKMKFLWLNSHGALLKGLDVAIDAFACLPDLELHICSNMQADDKFLVAISNQLKASPNIVLEGWVDINSARFGELVMECAWIINTSFSEGGGGSTLNCMAKGLIPIVSISSSITLPDSTGYYLKQNNPAELVKLVKPLQNLPNVVMEKMSNSAYQFIAANHTLANFKNKYKAFLENVLQSTGNN